MSLEIWINMMVMPLFHKQKTRLDKEIFFISLSFENLLEENTQNVQIKK